MKIILEKVKGNQGSHGMLGQIEEGRKYQQLKKGWTLQKDDILHFLRKMESVFTNHELEKRASTLTVVIYINW